MAKRKDAAKAVKPAAAPSPPSSNPRAPPSPRSKPSPLRTFILLIRIASCCFALYVLWKRMHPPKEELDSVEDDGRVSFEDVEVDDVRRQAVLAAFKHSYSAYERDAFGFDDYHPISHHGSNMSPAGPVGYFVIDSLDSLLLTNSTKEYRRARDWVEKLTFDLEDKYHTFEITIRVLGGLLSAYHLSGETDQMLLDKAVDLADRLLPAFDTPSGLPLSFVNLKKRQGIADMDNRGWTSVAEAGTLQLEFKYLSHLTGKKVMDVIRKQPNKDGLVPIFMRPDTGSFVFSDIRLGSRGDSYYEYLSKQYFQTNRTEPVYLDMHNEAMSGIKKLLLKKSATKGLMYVSELLPRRKAEGIFEMVDTPKQDHLVCFLGATFLLGASNGNTLPLPPDESSFSESQLDDWVAGKGLIRTCVDTYMSSKTGLAPEIVNFYLRAADAKAAGRDWFINSRKLTYPEPPIDARNILRPETAESLFVAYRVTGNPIYRTWGWTIFEAFEKHCKLPAGGYASIRDVDALPVQHEDRMETFWLSETLKYLYLLFSDKDLIPLDRYVFSTEAHPLPIFTPTHSM
ncbi:mannosyl-oligosaccharide alpha-1,2-mannosidase, glycoside hydrolase family 47 protein [Rhodotorula toruloides]|uniref:alpha-1,2-Mannosidase n=1 Tax=Rhodotorula toruloides TaxID=5286 RepID=A0A511KAI1_RHOTO|nr:mannosyl-oligosaccharide alpha-1,2-mannosidase, glycoside hydrolase family 47 protein [Rhodotorula toruloides]